MKKELQANYIAPVRIIGSHQVERAFFSLRSTTWELVDKLRRQKNLTASEYIESLVMKAARGQ